LLALGDVHRQFGEPLLGAVECRQGDLDHRAADWRVTKSLATLVVPVT
jgi:hypothetical protein